MLKTEFPSQISLVLGALAPPFKEQVEAMGMTLSNHEIWEERHRAWNLLRIGGFLTENEIKRVGQRLVRGIGQDVHFEKAVIDLAQEIAAVAPAPPEPAESEEESAGGELAVYLTPEAGQ
jgi:hypothetical protein